MTVIETLATPENINMASIASDIKLKLKAASQIKYFKVSNKTKFSMKQPMAVNKLAVA